MKPWGWAIAVAGIVYLIIALNMDVSVSTSSTYVPGYGSIGGGDVANLDLMARRQNHVIVASLITLIGVLMGIFGKSNSDVSKDAPTVTPSATVGFEGDRDISSDGYCLWLAKTYGIARNDVFERFVMGEQTFETLNDALLSAHASEQEKQRLAEEARAAREAKEAERQAKAEAIAAEAAAEWERSKPKVMFGFIILAIIVAGAFYVLKETPEEREARLTREAAEETARLKKIEHEFNIVLPEGARNVEFREVKDYGFLCREKSSGTKILEFKTDSTAKDIRDEIAKSLGEGQPEYSFDNDPRRWRWENNLTQWTLTIFGPEVGRKENEINLCMWRAASSIMPKALPSNETFSSSAKPTSKKIADDEVNDKDVKAERSSMSRKPRTDRCWIDYCPCDTTNPDYGGADKFLCDRVRTGLPVDDEQMSIASGARDARRQLRESGF